MKVRMLTGLAGTTPAGEPLILDPDTVVDVPDELGRALCDGDDPRAVPVGETRQARREKAVRPRGEVRAA